MTHSLGRDTLSLSKDTLKYSIDTTKYSIGHKLGIQIIKDLLSGDAAKAKVVLLDSVIASKDSIISEKNDIIAFKDIQINKKNDIIQYHILNNNYIKQDNIKLANEIKTQRKKSTTIQVILVGFILFLTTKL